MSYRKAQEIAALTPATQIVTVADREGDLYDLYHEAYTSRQTASAYWLIRAISNRRLVDSDNNLQLLKLRAESMGSRFASSPTPTNRCYLQSQFLQLLFFDFLWFSFPNTFQKFFY